MNPHSTQCRSPLAPLPPARSSAPVVASRELDSHALLAGSPCIAIRHGEAIYWLRATRQGKLLLTK